MQPFTTHQGIIAPVDRANIDTDAIIPKQYLKSIRRTGFGPYLFDDWRYLDGGDLDTAIAERRENPDFVLNAEPYRDASILLARENFGCGSSREHAVWALENFGFRCVIAPSFGDIFYNNCFKNGVLPVVLNKEEIDSLFNAVNAERGLTARVDLIEQRVTLVDGTAFEFATEAYRRENLLEGLDDIALTLQHAEAIRVFETQRREQKPWLYREL